MPITRGYTNKISSLFLTRSLIVTVDKFNFILVNINYYLLQLNKQN